MPENSFLLISLAASLKETDEIIEMLQQSIIDYKAGGDVNAVISTSLLLLHKQSLDKAYNGDITKAVEDLFKMQKAYEHEKPNSQ